MQASDSSTPSVRSARTALPAGRHHDFKSFPWPRAAVRAASTPADRSGGTCIHRSRCCGAGLPGPGQRRAGASEDHRHRLGHQRSRRGRFGQRRHRHAEAARSAHRVPSGRAARSRAGPHRQPAQRRGQGQPVLPARLQSRPRHRPAHQRRRHAGQPAQPRPRPRLDRSELRDPRTCHGAALQEGPVRRQRRRLRVGRRRRADLRRYAGCRHRQPGLRAERLQAGAAGRFTEPRRRPVAVRAGSGAQRRAVHPAGRLPQVQRRAALQPGRPRQRLERHRHGLHRPVERDRPDPAA